MTSDSLILNRRTPVLTKMGGYHGDETNAPRKKERDIFLATEALVLHTQFLQYNIQKIAQLEWSSIPGTGRLFPPHHVQTRSGTHPVSYPKSTIGSYHNSKFSAAAIIYEFLI